MDQYQIVEDYLTDRISCYRTEHIVDYYCEVYSVHGFKEVARFAREKGRPLAILGNGSNLIFKNRRVRTVLVRSRMPAELRTTQKTQDIFWLSATLTVMKAMRYCLAENRDCFYYLASVPATIGGALAMNAGRGIKAKKTIYDFVDRVTYIDPDSSAGAVTVAGAEVVKGHRKTIFSGLQRKIIIGAEFRFPKAAISGDPIKERIEWSKRHQDYSGPNCGTVFRQCRGKIMPLLRGLGTKDAHFSRACDNWIINRSKDPAKLLRLIRIGQICSLLALKPAKLENIVIE